jgi:hypothetical protein
MEHDVTTGESKGTKTLSNARTPKTHSCIGHCASHTEGP